jgi:outer membrane protein
MKRNQTVRTINAPSIAARAALLSIGLFLVILLGSTTASAQLKFGHLNSAELVSDMPETKKADEELKKYTEDLQAQFQSMNQDLQTKYSEYQAKGSTLSDAIREIKAKEISDLQGRIDEFQQSAQETVSRKKEELYGPIINRANKAVKDVGKAGKYTYILDTSVGTVIYFQESDDISNAVRKELGMPPAAPKKVDTGSTGTKGTTEPKR